MVHAYDDVVVIDFLFCFFVVKIDVVDVVNADADVDADLMFVFVFMLC